MCIIVAKPAGVPMPSDVTIANCFYANSDGAGFMVATGKTVSIRKGYMTLDNFMDAVDEFGDLTDRSVVMHFRIATHGGVKPSCCHPFPVSSNVDDLRALSFETRVAVAHNGIIDCMRSYTDKDTSDTMAYIMNVIAPIRRLSEDFMNNDNAMDVFDATVGSKLCFIDNSGDIVTIGDFIEDGGVLYSNTSYLRNTYGTYRSYEAIWDEMDDDDSYYDNLPYDACEYCINSVECAWSMPYCKSEYEALITADELYGSYREANEDIEPVIA